MSEFTNTNEQLAELSGKFEESTKRIDKNLEGIHDELKSINETLAKNTEQLAVHIKRTELNERHILAVEEKLHKDIEPIQKHVLTVQAYGKILLMFGAAPAFLYYVIKVFKEIFGQ